MLAIIIDYCKNNLVLTAVLAACLFLIILSVFALCVKKSVAKKKAKRASIVSVETKAEEPTAKEEVAPVIEEPAVKEEVVPVTEEPATKKEVAPVIEEPTATEEPIEETPVPVQEPSAPKAQKPKTTRVKPSRYTGKWTICRVITATADGASDEPTEETFFFELHASNGEKLLTSEEYTSLSGAVAGIATHKANIEKNHFRITLSKKGDYIFKLLNGKNMLLCMGEHYATKTRCESAIESTKRFSATAIVDDNVQDIVLPAPTEDDAPIEIPDNGYNGKWIVRAHTAEDFEQVFYFELFASNGEKLLSSEEYTTYTGAINGIETHKTNIEKGRFRISFTKRGDYIYKLLNGNGQLLCLGEHYKTRARCESAIESVKRFAKNAPVLADPETVHKHA